MIKILYYHYYLFYRYILKDTEPHLLATLALAFSLSLPINLAIDIIITLYANHGVSHWAMISVVIAIIGFLYNGLHLTGKAKEIVKEKPYVYNRKITIILVTLFFVSTLSILFWGPSLRIYLEK